jgi:hypothetical protein
VFVCHVSGQIFECYVHTYCSFFVEKRKATTATNDNNLRDAGESIEKEKDRVRYTKPMAHSRMLQSSRWVQQNKQSQVVENGAKSHVRLATSELRPSVIGEPSHQRVRYHIERSSNSHIRCNVSQFSTNRLIEISDVCRLDDIGSPDCETRYCV